jgi:hypothetical protein
MNMEIESILKAAGFVRDPNRDLWFSRDRRRAFSQEVLSDHDTRWLELKLLEDVPEDEFRFYRHTSNLKTCVEILDQLGLGVLTPVESLS